MPHVGPVLEGRTFFCPHCGALYSATPSLVPKSEGNPATCVICLKIMDDTARFHPPTRGCLISSLLATSLPIFCGSLLVLDCGEYREAAGATEVATSVALGR